MTLSKLSTGNSTIGTTTLPNRRGTRTFMQELDRPIENMKEEDIQQYIHEKWGEVIKAIIVKKPGTTLTAKISIAREE